MLNAETKPKFLCLPYTKKRKKITEKELFKEEGSGGLKKNRKEDFLIALTTAIMQDPSTSIRNHANELKVHEKIARTAIKQESSPVGSWRTSGDHPNYYIIENGRNTEKSLGDLRRFAVTQTPVKNHQQTLLCKTLMSE